MVEPDPNDNPDVDAGAEGDVDASVDEPDAAPVCETRLAITRFGGNQDILTVNADGSDLTNITDPGAGNFPAWSPDGTKFAYFVVGNPDALNVMNADGSGIQELTTGRSPSWSPDGQKITFTRRENAQTDIYAINADGTGEVRLTTLGGLRPIWAPDGSKIVFEADRDGDRDIFAMNPDGTGQVNLSVNTVTDSRPTVSPDSSRVIYGSNGVLGVVNIDGTGSGTRTLGGIVSAPHFSPDGSLIVFSSEQDGTNNVIVSAIDGTNAIILGEGTLPKWSPAGDAIAYLEGNGVAVADAAVAASGTKIVDGSMLSVDWSPCQP